jgi:tetratricopeptide (TPR) repeat protein
MLLTFLLALTLQAAPAPTAAQLAETYALFVEGQALADDGDLAGAIAKYQQALLVLPGAAEIRAELAGAYAQQGDLTSAESEATRALAADPDSRPAHRLMGLIVASRVGRAAREAQPELVQRATGHLERSTAQATNDPVVMLTLGELYVRGENYPRAIATLEQFLLDRPGYPQGMLLLADAYRRSGKPEAAQALLEGLGGSPEDTPEARRRDAAAHASRGEWEEAADAWADVLADDPRDSSARLQYAAALANAGDLAGARGELLALTRDQPEEIAGWHLLARVELRVGRLQIAEEAARKIEEIDPTDSRGPLTLAAIRAERDDYQSVVAILDRRVATPREADMASGAFAEMAARLADAWTRLGNHKRAVATLESARARLSEHLGLAFSLAAAYEKARDYDKAEKTFRAIIAADPEHDGALNYLGYMLADRGKKLSEALSLIERALVIEPDNAAYLDSLGWAYFKLKRYGEAVGPLERAAAGAAESSVIQEHLGDAYFQLKRYADAARAFDRALSGDRDGVDAARLTSKRDKAQALAPER